MSIIVSVKINDGVVMAADSATTFYKPNGEPGQIYQHANKIVNLVKGLPIGVMTCGSAGIGNASIETLLKDLRALLSKGGANQFDSSKYTLEIVAGEVKKFFAERIGAGTFDGVLILRICGYSSGAPLPEVWHVGFDKQGAYGPLCVQSQNDAGIRWDGEQEALHRLIGGLSGRTADAIVKEGILTQD
jgi:hypothetical protein